MGRKSAAGRAVSGGTRALKQVGAAKRALDEVIESAAWLVGWGGVAALLVFAMIWLFQRDGRAPVIAPQQLPVWLFASMLAASLVGWSFANIGQASLSRALGLWVSRVAFVALPLFCLVAGWQREALDESAAIQALGPGFWLFVRLYPPLLMLLCVGWYLRLRAQPRKRVNWSRGLILGLLVAPFVLLVAYLELGVHVEFLDEPMRETMARSGSAAIILQLLMMYFVGDPA